MREWLGALVTGKHRPLRSRRAARPIMLPAEHAAVLTRAAAPRQHGVRPRQWIACARPSVESEDRRVLRRTGGGVPYEKFLNASTPVMAEESDQTVVAVLLDAHPAARCPASPSLPPGRASTSSTSAAGAGRALVEMARDVPERVASSGFDLSEEAVGAARANAAELSPGAASNLRLLVEDAATSRGHRRRTIASTWSRPSMRSTIR